jgi:hypothetical protein
MTKIHMRITLITIEEVIYEPLDDKPIDNNMDSIPVVDTRLVTFKGNNDKRDNGYIFHFVKAGIQDTWYTLIWNINHDNSIDQEEPYSIHKVQYMLINIERD